MSSSQDPRIKGTSTYDRDAIVKLLSDYYDFLATLPYIDPKDVLHPPPEGWLNVTKENFEILGKNDKVLDLLKHLPYVNMQSRPGKEYLISPDAHPCDYRHSGFHSVATKQSAGYCYMGGVEFPDWVVPITYGKKGGTYLMLDTTDGTVTRYSTWGSRYQAHYAPDDPRSWRDKCDSETSRLADVLKEWKQNYLNLTWMAVPMHGWDNVYVKDDDDESNEKIKELQAIFKEHGWSNAFRREECKEALEKWDSALKA